MTQPCNECGADPFKVQDYDKKTREHGELIRWHKRIRADHALEKAEWEIEKIRLVEGTKWLQRKTKKQSQTISTLENKIKKMKEQQERNQVTIRSMDGTETIIHG